MITLSARSERFQPQPMFRLMAEAQALERAGEAVIHLEIGDTSSFADPELGRLLREDPEITRNLGYSPSAGEPRLRDAFARHYSEAKGVGFVRENVVITPANAAISQLLAVLCDEGDRVLVPDPAFATYQLAARFNGLEPVFFPLREATGFRPDLGEVRGLLATTPRIRALIIDNPSNPLGVVQDVEIVEGLAALCAEYGIAFILDETYKGLVHDGRTVSARHLPTNFYIYSLSKDVGAPALRIGCVVGDQTVVAKIADYNSLFNSCSPKPLQLLAATYLEAGSARLAILRDAMAERVESVGRILSACPGLTYVRPNAAIFFYLNIARSGLDSETFARKLLREKRVCVCPGTGFGPSGSGYVRISLSGDEAALHAGCRKLVDFFMAHATAHAPGGWREKTLVHAD